MATWIGTGAADPGDDIKVGSHKVGIGTATPQDTLHVTGGNIRIENPDNNREIFFTDNGQIRWSDDNHRIRFRRSENILELREYGDIYMSEASGTVNMAVRSSGTSGIGIGAVGIGTTSPCEKLEVSGNIKASGSMKAGGQTFIDTYGYLKPKISSSVDASTNSIYIDSTSYKLCFRDKDGSSHDLY